LFGGTGMLGRAFGHALTRRSEHAQIVGYASSRADFCDPALFDRTLDKHVELVINCAAFTDVDGAESKSSLAMEVNGHAVGRLAQRCAELDIPLVHISTDYIFDGERDGAYAIDAEANPLNVYGESKLLGERLVREAGGEHLIARTGWLHASWGKNFVRTIYRLSAEQESLRVVSDQLGKPSSATQVAASTLALLDRRHRGTFHVCGGGSCSWFELAREIVRQAGHDCDVSACTSAAYSSHAERPRNCVLDLAETTRRIGPMNHWRDELLNTITEIENGTRTAPRREAA